MQAKRNLLKQDFSMFQHSKTFHFIRVVLLLLAVGSTFFLLFNAEDTSDGLTLGQGFVQCAIFIVLLFLNVAACLFPITLGTMPCWGKWVT